jgi:protein SCO1/2
MRLCALAALVGVALGPSLAGAGADLLASKEEFFTPKLGAAVPLDLTFRDEAGQSVTLADYFHDRPVILVPAYFECPMLCKLTLKDLVDGLKRVAPSSGDDFEVVVVSFDPREKPDLAARHKAAYVEQYARPGGERGWHFLTGEKPQIDRLLEAIGFRVVWDEEQRQYAHARGILVLTPRGVVSRYFLEGAYAPRNLQLSLVEASEGKVGLPMDRILLMCFSYDPHTGRYSLAVLRLVQAGGLLTVGALLLFWFVSWRRWRRALPAPGRGAQVAG